METTDSDMETARRNRIALIALGLLALGFGVALYFGLKPPPQMGTSEEVFKTVDALYTAVRNEDAKAVGECERRLNVAHEKGQLPAPARDQLNDIISRAQNKEWRSAAESLYDFMKGQRREGAIEHEKKPPPAKGKAR